MLPAYRIELATTGRAGCRDSACKSENLKIAKGELRFGTLVEFQGHTSWTWKHWGCVTWRQINNWKDVTEENPDLIDGFEELDAESQQKILQAFVDGRVSMEDWNHEPHLSEIGGSQRRPKRKSKTPEEEPEQSPSKKTKTDPLAAEIDNANDKTPSKRRRKTKTTAKVAEHSDPEHEDGNEDAASQACPEPVAKRRRGRPKKTQVDETTVDKPSADEETVAASKPTGKARTKRKAKLRQKVTAQTNSDEEDANSTADAPDDCPASDGEPSIAAKPGRKARAKRKTKTKPAVESEETPNE